MAETPIMLSVSVQWQCSVCSIVGNDFLADVPFGSQVTLASHVCGTASHVDNPVTTEGVTSNG